MGIFSFIKKTQPLNQFQDPYLNYDVQSIGNIVIPEKLTDLNAFMLANTVSELYFPIDFHADRLSKLRYFIANKNTCKEIKGTELNRLVTDINPLYSFSDLIYQYVFSYLADGNALTYRQKPSIYSTSKVTYNNITRVDVIQPNLYDIKEFTNVDYFAINDLTALIQRVEMYLTDKKTFVDNMDLIRLDNYSLKKRSTSYVLSKSPLFSANKNIDMLLSVYSARYNVYANNGAAGYLAKKNQTNTNTIESVVLEGFNKRQEILDDINNRNGLTGRRNLWGISGTPIEFVKTLATISELMPLDETFENAIKISAIYQIPSVLVPRKDNSTFDNQADAEKNVWENSLLSLAQTVCENWTKILGLKDSPYKIGVDTTSVGVLVENESKRQELITKKIDNLIKFKQLAPEIDVNKEIQNIYGKAE